MAGSHEEHCLNTHKSHRLLSILHPSPRHMMAGNSCSPEELTPLPQYGFGAELKFDNLVEQNPFLFRVYTPKQRSPFFDDSEPFFVGHQFNERFTVCPASLSSRRLPLAATYTDVARHMDWRSRHTSPFISTSFSFVWAIWEASRRYQANVKHDIEIAVIDARALVGRAVTAVELLRLSTAKEHHRDYWKWYRFALESQDVLVHESIPGTAIFASIPLLRILDKLPSYFLHENINDTTSSFDRLAWDATESKPSFRMFCQDMSAQFFRLSLEHRLRDTTAESVRLAATLLRPWFQKSVLDNFDSATYTASELSCVIAKWPGQGWTRDHAEIWDLIKATVIVLAEELQEKQEVEIQEPLGLLEDGVGELETVLGDYKQRETSGSVTTPGSSGPPSPRRRSALKPLSALTIRPESSSQSPLKPISRTPVEQNLPTPPTTPIRESVHVVEMDLQPPPSPSPSEPELETTVEEKILGLSDISLAVPIPETKAQMATKPHSMAETVSCVVTGLLFGVYIALCIVGSQRRTLVYLT